MKLLTGAILLLVSEQAFSHAYLIQFPHHIFASEVLVPASIVCLIPGVILLLWGLWDEVTQRRTVTGVNQSVSPPDSADSPSSPSTSETAS